VLFPIDNKLSLHVGKTECILFGSRVKLQRVTDFSISYNGQTIKSQKCIKYLGITIDQTLSGDTMVNQVVNKVIGRLKFLYRHSSYLNQTLRKNLCSALLQCHIDYCCNAWFTDISAKARGKLQITQNKIVRFILSLSPREHVDQEVRNSVKMLSTQDLVKQLRINHVFNIFNGTAPSYLAQNFTRASRTHSHCTRTSNYNFLVPSTKGIAANTFFCNAIRDWNALPPQIQIITNKDTFKKAVKKHLAECALRQDLSDYIYM